MAIFVLIVIILLIQVRPEGIPIQEYEKIVKENEEYAKTIKEKEEIIEEKEQEINEASAQLEDYIATSNLELIVIVDGTGSMTVALDQLRAAIDTIAEAMPLIATNFNIGIIVYRDNLTTFSNKQIFPARLDGGASLDAVKDFTTNNMVPIGGPAYISDAISSALAMFQNSQSRKTLLILGDIGPYEIIDSSGNLNYTSSDCSNPSGDQQLRLAIKDFSTKDDQFRLITLFSINEEWLANQPEEWKGFLLQCRNNSMNFFKSMSSELGENGKYSDDVSQILRLLLEGILGVEKS